MLQPFLAETAMSSGFTATGRSLVVMPTYNERENIERIVPAVLAQSEDFDVLVVDDMSPDGTGEISDRLHDEHGSRVNVMHRQGKRGLGQAYRAGFRWALDRGYDYVFEMDSDFSHDPADLLRLREAVSSGRADVAVGSRWVGHGGTRNWSPLRKLISRGGSLYSRIMLGVPVRDLTTGFKCFRREVLQSLKLDAIESNGYGFQVELNYRCHQLGYRIAEVPIVFVDRRVGQSKMGGNIVWEAALVVLRLRLGLSGSPRDPK
jgi:dolichol-phosphate mannosyltransferase